MRQGFILTGLGIAVWAVATLFFLLFGDWVVLPVGEPYFESSLFLLEMLSVLLLIGLSSFVRLRLFKQRGSATRFGFIAASAGLLLNTFTVWHRETVFPAFDEGQHHSYAVWMTLTYALALIVPAIVDRIIKEPEHAAESPNQPLQAASAVGGTEETPAADADAPSETRSEQRSDN